MARVREGPSTPDEGGHAQGLAVTGGVITSAGVVLAGTFSVLAVLPLVALTQIGITVAFGVLLDTFVVRLILVPALTFELGRRIWWPSRLARRSVVAGELVREPELAPDGGRPRPRARRPGPSCCASASSPAACTSRLRRSVPGRRGDGLLSPNRTKGGFRLYGADDIARVLAMRANLERGLSAAEAARLALSETHDGATPLLAEAAAELDAALSIFDEASAQAVLDRLFGRLSIDAALREGGRPYLHELGERWQRGEVSIAQEHFAATAVRGRLMAMARGWGRGSGPLAVLACAEDEQHDIPVSLRPSPSHVRVARRVPRSRHTAAVTRAGSPRAPPLRRCLARQRACSTASRPAFQEVALHAPLYVAGAAASEELARQARRLPRRRHVRSGRYAR